jgi:hypothetical protein
MARPLRPIRRYDEIHSRPAQTDQFPQCLGAASRTRASDGPKTEPRDDPLDQFAVAVPADEHIGFRSAISERHHQLLRVPERDDHPPPLV